jgi:NAD(P)-dependent dehydrogenase (short-subunit alcohol dehydrogenase family)
LPPPRAAGWSARGADTGSQRAQAGFSTPERVADLITLLAAERTANVTGANHVIDGGLIKTT